MTSKSDERRARKKARKHRPEVFGEKKADVEGPTPQMMDRRAEMVIATIVRYPDHAARGLGRELARNQDAGTLLGRLYLIGALDWKQKAAADQLLDVMKKYRQAVNKYSTVKISNPVRVGGTGSENFSPKALRKFARIQQQYEELRQRLSACGPDVEKAVMAAAEEEEFPDIRLIQQGLTAISTA